MNRLATCLAAVSIAAVPAAVAGSESPKPAATSSISTATITTASPAAALPRRWNDQKWEFKEMNDAIRLTTPIPFDRLVGASSSTTAMTQTKPITYQIGLVKGKPVLIVVDTPKTELTTSPINGECPKTVAMSIDTLVDALAGAPDSVIQKCEGKKRCTKLCAGEGGREYCCEYTCDGAS